jgi:hypothetical protein
LAATFGQENTLRLWDLATAEQLHVRRRAIYGPANVAFTPDSQQLLWANTPISVEFLDVAVLAKKKENASATVRETRGAQFATFVVSEDGKTLVANNSQSGGAQIWDLTQKDPAVTNISPTFGANGIPLAYSPDTRLSATQFTVDGSGRQLVIADLLRGREVTRLVSPPGQQIVQGAFAGTRLFASRGVRQIALWDVLSGKSVVNVNVESSGNTTAVACSPDGRLLAWAESDNDRTIRLYDALNGREVGKFSGHIGDVVFLRMHLAGDRPLLLSGSNDSTVLVWDLREVMELVRTTTPRLSAQHAEQVWVDLGAEDATAMHRASWLLAAAGDEAMPMLAARLEPVPIDPTVGDKVRELVVRMDDDLFSVREQASQQAAELGEAAEPYLKDMLKATTSAEARHRIRRLLTDIAGKPLVFTTDQQRSIRAVQVLEQIGGVQAREILLRLSQGQPSARLTQEAKNSLLRLEEEEKRRQ